MPYEISPLAQADLLEIGDYIARDNPRRAEIFVDELLEHGEKIARMPTGYVERDELTPGLRSCTHKNYIIFFRIVASGTRIERILNAARDLTNIDFDV